MAPAIAHFLVGAGLLLLIAAPFALRYPLQTRTSLWLIPIGGLWGLAPDIHHISPVWQSELYAIHNSPWMDLFALHYFLDRPTIRGMYYESVFGSILFFLIALAGYSLAQELHDQTIDIDAPLRQLLVVILVAGIATGYAGVGVTIYLLNIGTLSALGGLVGPASVGMGWLVLVGCCLVAGISIGFFTELFLPEECYNWLALGPFVGVLYSITGWLILLAVDTRWLQWLTGSTDTLSLFWPESLAIILFGVVFGSVYWLLRGAVQLTAHHT